jgi:transcriptional regulator of acetoin/glycerol metabolism
MQPQSSPAAARERFLEHASASGNDALAVSRSARAAGPAVRPEIAASWLRSQLSGADPDRCLVPFELEKVDQRGKLVRTAVPVLGRLSERLGGLQTSLSLTDAQGRILWRWVSEPYLRRQMDRLGVAAGFRFGEDCVGTNGIGMALELRRPVQVDGPEHFTDALDVFCCTAAPVQHPVTHRLVGAVNITCRTSDASGLLLPMVGELATQVQERVLDEASVSEQALLRAFVAARRRSAEPLISVNEGTFLSNGAARELLGGLDHAELWESLREAVAYGRDKLCLTLPSGEELSLRVRAVDAVEPDMGVIATLRRSEPRHHAPQRDSLPGLAGTSVAWQRTVAAVRSAAAGRRPVLLRGEPGCGKTSCALALARLAGTRVTRLDLAVSELAGWRAQLGEALSGSAAVLLAHVDMLPPRAAAALASDLEPALETRHPRILATCTTRDAADPPLEPVLRERLAGAVIAIPPLRSRPEDIPELVRHISGRPAGPDALRVLREFDWPGNLTQLGRVLSCVERNAVGPFRAADLPGELRFQRTRRRLSPIQRGEFDVITEMLERCEGNISAAARTLGLSRSTLYRRLRVYGLRR